MDGPERGEAGPSLDLRYAEFEVDFEVEAGDRHHVVAFKVGIRVPAALQLN